MQHSKLSNRFLEDTSGATAIEYGLLVAVISIVLLSSTKAIGDVFGQMFSDIANIIDTEDAQQPTSGNPANDANNQSAN